MFNRDQYFARILCFGIWSIALLTLTIAAVIVVVALLLSFAPRLKTFHIQSVTDAKSRPISVSCTGLTLGMPPVPLSTGCPDIWPFCSMSHRNLCWDRVTSLSCFLVSCWSALWNPSGMGDLSSKICTKMCHLQTELQRNFSGERLQPLCKPYSQQLPTPNPATSDTFISHLGHLGCPNFRSAGSGIL